MGNIVRAARQMHEEMIYFRRGERKEHAHMMTFEIALKVLGSSAMAFEKHKTIREVVNGPQLRKEWVSLTTNALVHDEIKRH